MHGFSVRCFAYLFARMCIFTHCQYHSQESNPSKNPIDDHHNNLSNPLNNGAIHTSNTITTIPQLRTLTTIPKRKLCGAYTKGKINNKFIISKAIHTDEYECMLLIKDSLVCWYPFSLFSRDVKSNQATFPIP